MGYLKEKEDRKDSRREERSKMNRSIYLRSGMYALAGGALFSVFAAPVMNAYAVTFSNATQSYRDQVISVCGIAESTDPGRYVTRSEFAKMAVSASRWKDTVSAVNTVAAANDVPASESNSGYIMAALRNGLMRTRLGGNFAPTETVTLNDAVKACLPCLDIRMRTSDPMWQEEGSACSDPWIWMMGSVLRMSLIPLPRGTVSIFSITF